MADIREERLAHLLTHYSVEVKKGDLVLIRGGVEAEPLLKLIHDEVLSAGGHPRVQASIPGLETSFYKLANKNQLTKLWPDEELIARKVDKVIAVGASTNTKSLTKTDPAKQAISAGARRNLQKIFMKRSATKDLKWVYVLYPTQAFAQDAEMSLEEYADFVYASCLCHKPNPDKAWKKVAKDLSAKKRKLDKVKSITVKGPGTDLSLSVEGRTWIPCDGHYNMPDGEIFTAPVESSVNGHVTFSFPCCFRGREVEGVRLEFKKGQVVKATAEKNEKFLLEMLNMDKGAKRLGEFAIATNYSIKDFSRSILFDEKIGGTIHMALGASYPESGGKNHSALHWDMICDLRKEGELRADGKLVLRKGKVLI